MLCLSQHSDDTFCKLPSREMATMPGRCMLTVIMLGVYETEAADYAAIGRCRGADRCACEGPYKALHLVSKAFIMRFTTCTQDRKSVSSKTPMPAIARPPSSAACKVVIVFYDCPERDKGSSDNVSQADALYDIKSLNARRLLPKLEVRIWLRDQDLTR